MVGLLGVITPNVEMVLMAISDLFCYGEPHVCLVCCCRTAAFYGLLFFLPPASLLKHNFGSIN